MGNLLRRGIDAYQQGSGMQPHEKNKNTTENNQKAQLPEQTPVLIRSTKPAKTSLPAPETTADKAAQPQKDSKYRRVAKFLILVGGDQAAKILAQLEPEQVEKISREIALVKTVRPDEAAEIMQEFQSMFSMSYSHSGLSSGGVDAARRILYAAMGPKKGETILNRAVPESKENIFDFLDDFTPEQLVVLLRPETPQTIALILSRLPTKISAETINKMPPYKRVEVLRRIAHQKDVLPEVLEHVAAALKEKVRYIAGGARDLEVDGMQKLAAILKQADYAFGDRIVNELEESRPEIGRTLKEKLYTLDDVLLCIDRPLQEKFKDMSDSEIAILLKGRKNEFREKILSCVSEGRAKRVIEEGEILGYVPRRDCDAAAKEFLAWFRDAREKGQIILVTDGDVFL